MMAARRRRAGRRGAPSAELAEDELARHWSLSPEDLIEIRRCRGADHRRRFALQLCMLRAHGRFFDDYRQAPLRIVNHLSRQLDLPPVLFLDRPRRDTDRTCAGAAHPPLSRHQELRRCGRSRPSGLGAPGCGRRPQRLPSSWAGRKVACAPGRSWCPRSAPWSGLSPPRSPRSRPDLFDVIAQRLPASLRDAIGLLLEVPEGDARSSLFRLKDHAKSAKAATIKGDLVRLGLIDELLLGGGVGLDDVDPRVVRQLGELGRRYDSGDLRRFASPKRDALVACYLVEARKSLLDQVVELHDQFMITMSRRARHAAEAQLRVCAGGPATAWNACSARSRP